VGIGANSIFIASASAIVGLAPSMLKLGRPPNLYDLGTPTSRSKGRLCLEEMNLSNDAIIASFWASFDALIDLE
jgi:hypothetical protein